MRRTPNYSLLLPDEDDFYNIEEANFNSEIVDAQIKINEEQLESQMSRMEERKTISLTGDVTGSATFNLLNDTINISTTSKTNVPAGIYPITMVNKFIFEGGKLTRYGDVVTLTMNFSSDTSLIVARAYEIATFPSELAPEIVIRTMGVINNQFQLPVMIEYNKVKLYPAIQVNAMQPCGFSISWNIKK